MTTRVKIECPGNSHWHVRVNVQVHHFVPDAQMHAQIVWTTTSSKVLKQGESAEFYVHTHARLMLEEVEPEEQAHE